MGIPDLDEIIINEHLLKKRTASDLLKIEKNKDIVASTEVDKQITDGQSENLALKLGAKHDVSMKDDIEIKAHEKSKYDEKEFYLSSSGVELYSVKTDEKEKEKEEEPKHLTEKSSEGEIKKEIPEPSEKVSSKDQDTTENSSEVSAKDDTKEKEEEAKVFTEKSLEGETKLELPEKSSEGEIKDETKDLNNKEEAEDLAEISSDGEIEEKTPKYSEQVSSKDQYSTDKSLDGEIKD